MYYLRFDCHLYQDFCLQYFLNIYMYMLAYIITCSSYSVYVFSASILGLYRSIPRNISSRSGTDLAVNSGSKYMLTLCFYASWGKTAFNIKYTGNKFIQQYFWNVPELLADFILHHITPLQLFVAVTLCNSHGCRIFDLELGAFRLDFTILFSSK